MESKQDFLKQYCIVRTSS